MWDFAHHKLTVPRQGHRPNQAAARHPLSLCHCTEAPGLTSPREEKPDGLASFDANARSCAS
jgi:hypothetical protein